MSIIKNECEAWQEVAIESFQAIDKLCRKILPDLPVHYGMPQDAVRLAFNKLKDDLNAKSSCTGTL